MKLPNGYGSIYKMSGKRRNPWVFAVTDDYVLDIGSKRARRKYRIVETFATRAEAWKFATEYNESASDKFDFTLKQIYDEWSAKYFEKVSKNTEISRRASYAKIRKYEGMRFRDISTGMWQDAVDQSGDFSVQQKVRSLISLLCEYAMKYNVVNKNHAELLVISGGKKITRKDLSDDDLLRVIHGAADGIPYADCILILCLTGLRIEEFCTLTVGRYNIVDQYIQHGNKTEAGRRKVVPVHPMIQPYMAKWVAKGGQTIFCRPDGRPYSTRAFREGPFRQAVDALGIRKITPHECKHTFASLLDRANARESDIAALLGHTRYDTSLENYIHKRLPDLRRAVNGLQLPSDSNVIVTEKGCDQNRDISGLNDV